QADVGRVDAEGVHEVKEADLCGDRRVENRRRLQAVAQGLVVELDRARGHEVVPCPVPVVDQPRLPTLGTMCVAHWQRLSYTFEPRAPPVGAAGPGRRLSVPRTVPSAFP